MANFTVYYLGGVCVRPRAQVHRTVHMEISRQLSGVSSSTTWGLGLKLSSSDLMVSTFIC